MMNYFYLITCYFLGLALVDKYVHGCASTVSGATWKFTWGVDQELQGVESVAECSELCANDVKCQGYTWKSNDIIGYCYKFQDLEGIHACDKCSSGTMPQTIPKSCTGSVDDIIDFDVSASAEDCALLCQNTSGCVAYTWWNQSTPFQNTCFLYAECDDLLPCYGCTTGKESCIASPQCFEYNILDEETRNSKFSNPEGSKFCDDYSSESSSPRWKGSGYYRFLEPAGHMMPNTGPGRDYCGTWAAAWIPGTQPTEQGLEVSMEACVYYQSDECYSKVNITSTFCDDYYVYFLNDITNVVITEGCGRYCAAPTPK